MVWTRKTGQDEGFNQSAAATPPRHSLLKKLLGGLVWTPATGRAGLTETDLMYYTFIGVLGVVLLPVSRFSDVPGGRCGGRRRWVTRARVVRARARRAYDAYGVRVYMCRVRVAAGARARYSSRRDPRCLPMSPMSPAATTTALTLLLGTAALLLPLLTAH